MGWNDKTQALWTPRSVADTVKLYAEWADQYETDILEAGYATPGRMAQLISEHISPSDIPILDFGCGTGLSGVAMRAVGFSTLDGTDITAEMLEQAHGKGAYRTLWQSDPEVALDVDPGTYALILACGVISLGAAPPETLNVLLNKLNAGGFLAFSYNDATLKDESFVNALQSVIDEGIAVLIAENYGPHLPERDMGSSIYLLQKL